VAVLDADGQPLTKHRIADDADGLALSAAFDLVTGS
jgi:hypothetical protein